MAKVPGPITITHHGDTYTGEIRAKDPTWKLKEIRISHISYGELKGQYKGTLEFYNSKEEAFLFRLDHDMCNKYLELIGHQLIIQAHDLGRNLLASIGIENILLK